MTAPNTAAGSAPTACGCHSTPRHGPGTELKELLRKIGIAPGPDCVCHAQAMEMNRRGAEWCEQNMSTIVGWLREGARREGLFFNGLGARFIVRAAIRESRREAARRAAQSQSLGAFPFPNNGVTARDG